LQGSLISPILFNLYINDLINEIDKHAFDILAYADDLAIICEGKNQLINIFNIIEKWTKNNGIMVNKNKSGIMVIKGTETNSKIEGYPVIKEYKYLGITINNKLQINKHVGNINKKLNEYFTRNYILNKRLFSVKSIMLIFGYFHKSRMLYGLPAFIDQKVWINRIDKILTNNIKKLLKLPIRTNTERLKLALGIPDLMIYLACRLIKLKQKYENIFQEKLTIYDDIIKKTLEVKTIPNDGKIFIFKNIKTIGQNYNVNVDQNFTKRLKSSIYNWYVDGDFLLLKYMCHRGAFRSDIFEKCILCKKENNGIEHVTNECQILNDIRNKTIEELTKLNINTQNKTFLHIIEYIYYNKKYTTNKNESQKDRRCINLIKNFIKEMYISFGKNNKKNED